MVGGGRVPQTPYGSSPAIPGGDGGRGARVEDAPHFVQAAIPHAEVVGRRDDEDAEGHDDQDADGDGPREAAPRRSRRAGRGGRGGNGLEVRPCALVMGGGRRRLRVGGLGDLHHRDADAVRTLQAVGAVAPAGGGLSGAL